MIPKEILKKVQHIHIRSKHLANDVFAGQYQSVFKGQGMEFHEVREYMPGDDIRSIDWNVTARMGHPFVKKFVEERERTLMLLVDISGSNEFGSSHQLKRDLATEVAAVLAFAAIRNQDRVGLILFSDEVERYIPPGKGIRHVLRVIREVLAHKPQSRQTNPLPALDYLNQVTRHQAVVFFISDFIFQQDASKAMTVTSKRHDLIGVLVGDKREFGWPKAGIVEWTDAETGETFIVDTHDSSTRQAIHAAQTQQRQTVISQLRSMGIDSLEIYAGEPYDRELMRFFKAREKRLR